MNKEIVLSKEQFAQFKSNLQEMLRDDLSINLKSNGKLTYLSAKALGFENHHSITFDGEKPNQYFLQLSKNKDSIEKLFTSEHKILDYLADLAVKCIDDDMIWHGYLQFLHSKDSEFKTHFDNYFTEAEVAIINNCDADRMLPESFKRRILEHLTEIFKLSLIEFCNNKYFTFEILNNHNKIGLKGVITNMMLQDRELSKSTPFILEMELEGKVERANKTDLSDADVTLTATAMSYISKHELWCKFFQYILDFKPSILPENIKPDIKKLIDDKRELLISNYDEFINDRKVFSEWLTSVESSFKYRILLQDNTLIESNH